VVYDFTFVVVDHGPRPQVANQGSAEVFASFMVEHWMYEDNGTLDNVSLSVKQVGLMPTAVHVPAIAVMHDMGGDPCVMGASADAELNPFLPSFLLSGFLVLDASWAFPWIGHGGAP
jgi:hypothetical protein